MTADLLREAASLMRERAEAAPAGSPWAVASSRTSHRVTDNSRSGVAMAVADVFPTGGSDHQRQMAEHIASWHPAVALAVADWLDRAADEPWCCDECKFAPDNPQNLAHDAVLVARAYLGSAS